MPVTKRAYLLSYVFPKKLEMDFQVLFPLPGTYVYLLRLEVYLILIGSSGSRELGEEDGWSILCFWCIALPSRRVFQEVLKIIFCLVTEVISWIWFPPLFKKESEKSENPQTFVGEYSWYKMGCKKKQYGNSVGFFFCREKERWKTRKC